ncbi:thioesterase-like superfamily-domain-containing protein [Pilobolus umbonatus]|nr:thioesterase-like superfamily-domain-containing protein [Pilobolus umbonatus]
MYLFDQYTTTKYLGKVGPRTYYSGYASKVWAIGEVPNGGYVAALVLDASLQHYSTTHQPHPIAFNTFFLRKTDEGGVLIEIEDIKMGKTGYAVSQIRMKQAKDLSRLISIEDDLSEYTDKTISIITMGDLHKEHGLTYTYKPMTLVPVDQLTEYTYPYLSHTVNTSIDLTKLPSEQPGLPELNQVIEFKDHRPNDFKSIPYWCDMILSPPTFLGKNILDSWCATMQIEIQFKAIPTGTKAHCTFLARHIKNSRFGLDGEVYNEQGELMAITK